MSMLTSAAIQFAELGLAPDSVMASAIRRSCRNRLNTVRTAYLADEMEARRSLLTILERGAIAEDTGLANEQHYELPVEFFGLVLGPHRKYSGCEWPLGVDSLEAAERIALETIVHRARLEGARRILELGCGWGSLTLFMAQRYPQAQITAVSNSQVQRGYIQWQAQLMGLENVTVICCDINAFAPEGQFDRIVTVEMLEHVRNHRELFGRMARWLEADGKLFVHVFRHIKYPYTFETGGAGNWMGRLFFTGGIMPSHDLLTTAQDSLALAESWVVDGTHYSRTADAWLHNLDANRIEVRKILAAHYGEADSDKWLNRWRIFFMSCRELFGYANGTEWGVSHYLFQHCV